MTNNYIGFREGTVLWLDLGSIESNGELTAGRHPCLIVRVIDKYKCLIVPITSKKLDRMRDSEIELLVGEGGLTEKSKLLVDQSRPFSSSKFRDRDLLGCVTEKRLEEARALYVRLLS